ncbi:MAG: LytR/AlgR family response regulator transcription factor, partial [Bacteroidia bacterium]
MQPNTMEIKKMRCLVVDDEIVARRGIIRQLEKIKSLEVVGEANCIDAFIEVKERCKPDLIFMDIMLRNKNSMDYLSSVIDLPMVVFVTAYSHHAITGFDLKAVDYLLKPVSDHRLNQCIEKAHQLFHTQSIKPLHQAGNLFLKSNGKYYNISPSDISFIKSMENYVVVYLETKKLVCKLTMEQMVRLLPSGLFFQVHRSYLVNVKKIDFIEKLNI